MSDVNPLFFPARFALLLVLGLLPYSKVSIAGGHTNDNLQFYFGASYGVVNNSVHLNHMFGVEALDGCQDCWEDIDNQPYSLFVGIDFNKYQSFKASYIDFNEVFSFRGTVDGQVVSIDQDTYGFVVSQKLSYPLYRHIQLYGQFGVIFWNSNVSYFEYGSRLRENADSDVQLAYGFGVSYLARPSVMLSVEYNNYSRLGDSSTVVVSDSLVESLGLDIETLNFSIEYYFRWHSNR